MKRLVLFLVLVSAFVFAGQASAAMVDCFGAPADYVTAYDGVRGQPIDGKVTYAYPTVYTSFQSWLTPNVDVNGDGQTDIPSGQSMAPGHHSEHIHFEGCFANNEVWNDANAPKLDRWFDTKIIFHHVVDYVVVSHDAALRHLGGSVGCWKSTVAQEAELNAAAQNSANSTQTVFESYKCNAPVNNGVKELTSVITVDRSGPGALVEQWFLDSRVFIDQQYAGLTETAPVAPNVGFMRARTWICWNHETQGPKCRYGYTGFGDTLLNRPTRLAEWKASQMGVDRPDVWNVSWRSTDGPFRGDFFVDQNFHQHPDTFAWHQKIPEPIPTLDGGREYRANVPLAGLTGVHRLMLMGHVWPNCCERQPIQTNIMVIPFAASVGDTQAPSVPTGFGLSNRLPTSLALTWAPSTDNVGVAGYRLYRDGVLRGSTQNRAFTFTGLTGPTHLLQVEAYDAAGNVSAKGSRTITKVGDSWQ